MLDMHPRIAIPPEAHVFTNIPQCDDPWGSVWSGDELLDVVRKFLAKERLTEWGPPYDVVVGALADRVSASLADIVTAIYGAYAGSLGKVRWGDKTPVNSFHAQHLAAAFPNARFVHIVRDGRDVALSWQRVAWNDYTIEEAARSWKSWLLCATYCQRLGPNRYLEVLFDELVREPERELRRICRFLGEEYTAVLLDYPQRQLPLARKFEGCLSLLDAPPQEDRCQVWKREMAPADRRRFERLVGTMLVRFGFEVSWSTWIVARTRQWLSVLRRFAKRRS